MDKNSILMIDDQDIILKAVGRLIENRLKYQVTTINSVKNDFGNNLESLIVGVISLSKRMEKPILVIDYNMESADKVKFTGIDILKKINLGMYEKIILYTTDSLSEIQMSFLNKNNICYITKTDSDALISELEK